MESYLNTRIHHIFPIEADDKSSKAVGMETLFDGIKGYAKNVKDQNATLDVLDAFLVSNGIHVQRYNDSLYNTTPVNFPREY